MKTNDNNDKSQVFEFFFISTIENFYLWFILNLQGLMAFSLGGSLSLFNSEVQRSKSL